jgi:hypothetical protein
MMCKTRVLTGVLGDDLNSERARKREATMNLWTMYRDRYEVYSRDVNKETREMYSRYNKRALSPDTVQRKARDPTRQRCQTSCSVDGLTREVLPCADSPSRSILWPAGSLLLSTRAGGLQWLAD